MTQPSSHMMKNAAVDPGAELATDVVVIGAGIIGAACAYRLAERGRSVICLEREPGPASGSTARSAAGVRIQFSDATNIALSSASIAEYALMPAAAYQPCGYLFLVPQAAWTAHLAGVELQRRMGYDVQVLDLAQSQAIVRSTSDGLAGATFHATDGFVDPHGITLEYVRRAREAGAVFHLRNEVVAIESIAENPAAVDAGSGPRWRVRGADGRSITCRWIVNACGAWSGRTGALAGLDIPVQPARRMVFSSGPLATAHRYPLTVDLDSGVWFRSEGQRLIFGRSDPEDLGFSEGMNWAWLEATIEPLLERFPWFEQIALDRRASWWGYYEVTPDHQPLVGVTRQAKGWLNACGFSGHGVQQAAAIGRIIAQVACDESPFIDIDSLSSDRFADQAMRASRSEGDDGGTAGDQPHERLIV